MFACNGHNGRNGRNGNNEAKVVALGGRDDDPSVSKERLASRLTQTLCKVDVIETNGDADLRAQRKKQYQRCLAALDSLEHH